MARIANFLYRGRRGNEGQRCQEDENAGLPDSLESANGDVGLGSKLHLTNWKERLT